MWHIIRLIDRNGVSIVKYIRAKHILDTSFYLPVSISSFDDIKQTDLVDNRSLLLEDVDPRIVANFMYELKDLSTEEHDSIITQSTPSLQAKVLLNIILEKQSIERFVYALEFTEHSCVLQTIRDLKKDKSCKMIIFRVFL